MEPTPEKLEWVKLERTPKTPIRMTNHEGNELVWAEPRVGVNISLPRAPIHIVLGAYEYTDEDIRQWAQGVPSYPDWHKALLIEYLSQIIVSQVLAEVKQ